MWSFLTWPLLVCQLYLLLSQTFPWESQWTFFLLIPFIEFIKIGFYLDIKNTKKETLCRNIKWNNENMYHNSSLEYDIYIFLIFILFLQEYYWKDWPNGIWWIWICQPTAYVSWRQSLTKGYMYKGTWKLYILLHLYNMTAISTLLF